MIYTLSDVHMGRGDARDNFTDNKKSQLFDLLRKIKLEDAELVIIGDLFDFWQGGVSDILMYRRDVIEFICGMRATYIIGNHDIDLKKFIGQDLVSCKLFNIMSEPFIREINGKKVKFMHGHEGDPFNNTSSPGWGRMISIFAGLYEDKNGSPYYGDGGSVEERLQYVGDKALKIWNRVAGFVTGKSKYNIPEVHLTPAKDSELVDENIQQIWADRMKDGYDIAILGHTHVPGNYEGWYYNDGSWVASRQENDYITIDDKCNISICKCPGERVINNRIYRDVVLST